MPILQIAACTVANAAGVTEPVLREPGRIIIQQGRSMKPDPRTGLIPPAPPMSLVDVSLDEEAGSLRSQTMRGVFHYLRQSDATLIPLPPEAAEVGHKLIPWRLEELGVQVNQPPTLRLRPGDAYVAVTPGAAALAEGTAIARFIHLRDYFNAERLAQALADDICGGRAVLQAPFTVLVVEAR